MRDGAAPAAVISTTLDAGPGRLPEECRQRPYQLVCIEADPGTTVGEVRMVRELAQQRGWRSVQLLTFRPHVSRARWLFGRCTDLDVRVIEVDALFGVIDVLHHVAGWAKALLRPEC